MEPFTEAEVPLSRKELTGLMTIVDIFSPNIAEAASMLGRQRDCTADRQGPDQRSSALLADCASGASRAVTD